MSYFTDDGDDSELLEKSIITSLNDLQQQATLFPFNDLLQIKAPPGSGKTKIIISRLLYLLICCKIPPNQIIVTTFGKKASLEIKQRLDLALLELNLQDNVKNDIISQLKVGTFHGLCLALLRQFGHLIGVTRVEILSESEQEQILKKAIQKVPDNIYDYYKYRNNKVNLMSPAKQQKKKRKNNNKKNSNKEKENGDNMDDDEEEEDQLEDTMFASLELNDKHWTFDINLIKKNISKLKTQGLTSDTYIKTGGESLDQALLYFYQYYESECKRLMKLDFDDLLLKTYLVLKQNKHIIPSSKHILVDEFQDTSFLQLQIVLLWSSNGKTGITVVGDPNQCIYAFRDASPSNFKDMIKLCEPQVQIIPLNQNYRSSQKIIDCCQYILKSSQTIDEEPLSGQFDCDYGPVYKSFKNFTLEAQFISNEIAYLKSLPNDVVKFSDIAILARTKRQIHIIEKKLLAYRIPYRIIDNNGFLQRKEVLQFMNLLKLVLHYDSIDNLVINDKKLWILQSLSFMENVGLGKTSLSNLSRFFDANSNKDPINLIKTSPQLDQVVSNTRGRTYLINFIKKFLRESFLFLEKLDGSKEGFTSFLEFIYKKSGLYDMFLLDDGEDEDDNKNKDKDGGNTKESKPEYDPRHYSIDSLKDLILNFREKDSELENPVFNKKFLSEFISSIELYAVEGDELEEEKSKNEGDKVTICTVHKSKGLEWPIVFVPGCSEDYIPCIFMDDMDVEGEAGDEDDPSKSNISFEKYKANNVSYQEKLNEERRIFYVALSRAKQLLYMTSIERSEQDSNSKIRPMIRTRFIDDDLVKKLKKYPNVFSDLKIIKQFYNSMNKEFKDDLEDFSIFQLIKDYNLYLRKGCKDFVWMSHEIMNINTINLNKNKLKTNSVFSGTNFMSAKEHIDLGLSNMGNGNENNDKKKQKRNIAMKNKSKVDITKLLSKKSIATKPLESTVPLATAVVASSIVPVNTSTSITQPQYAPQNNDRISRSPSRNPERAPTLSTQIERSPTRKQQFAPRRNDKILKSPERKPQMATPFLPTKEDNDAKRGRRLIKDENLDDIPLSKRLKLEQQNAEEIGSQNYDDLNKNNTKLVKNNGKRPKITIDAFLRPQKLKKIKKDIDNEEQEIIVLSE